MAAGVLPAAAGLLALLACTQASGAAERIDSVFKFHGLDIKVDGGSLDIGMLVLDGPIARDNTDIEMFGTTLDLTNPLPVGVGDKFTLGWQTPAGTFTDSMTETSVTGHDPNDSLKVIATGTISQAFSPTGPDFSPAASKVTLDFVLGGLTGRFTTLSSATAGVPEMSSWSMLLAGFAGLGAVGFLRARKAARGA